MHEFYTALMSFQSGKTPGMDGLPVEFYKASWSVMGEDFLEVHSATKEGRCTQSEELETSLVAL